MKATRATTGCGDMLRLIAVGLFFAAAAVLLHSDLAREFLHDPQRFMRMITVLSRGGPAGALLFALAAAGLVAVGIPRIWISAAAGAVFGLWMGFVLAMAATALGAGGTYVVGRGVLGEVVERRLGERLTVWKERFRENAFWWVLYGRLFPFSNSTLTSLLCGSCRVPFLPYFLATFIGFLPLTIVFDAFGSGAARGSHLQIAIGFLAIALTMAVRWVVERIRVNCGPSALSRPVEGKPLQGEP